MRVLGKAVAPHEYEAYRWYGEIHRSVQRSLVQTKRVLSLDKIVKLV